jgi:hypothetical protein
MTHDELVSALNKGITMVGQRMATHEEDANLYRRTVRAVVELHKGYAKTIPCPDNKEGCCVIHYAHYSFCDECRHPWPCPTIQAIEKELA